MSKEERSFQNPGASNTKIPRFEPPTLRCPFGAPPPFEAKGVWEKGQRGTSKGKGGSGFGGERGVYASNCV